MQAITLTTRGSFKRSMNFLKRIGNLDIKEVLERYGDMGLKALQDATPIDTGKTADSWYYTIDMYGGGASIEFFNSNVNDGVPIALIIEYGHGTRFGGYVPPQPYIQQALSPIFDEIDRTVWREIENA